MYICNCVRARAYLHICMCTCSSGCDQCVPPHHSVPDLLWPDVRVRGGAADNRPHPAAQSGSGLTGLLRPARHHGKAAA